MFHPRVDAEGRLQLDDGFPIWRYRQIRIAAFGDDKPAYSARSPKHRRPGVDHLVDVLEYVVKSLESITVEVRELIPLETLSAMQWHSPSLRTMLAHSRTGRC